MKKLCLFIALASVVVSSAQQFIRSELSPNLVAPWEIVYGPDNHLWLTESGGKILRVNPANGQKTTVYTAADYYGGSPLEKLNACFQPNIGAGTLGMDLYLDQGTGNYWLFFLYSYNSGNSTTPATRFKIARVTWNPTTQVVISDTTLVTALPNGYDHLGGRLKIIPQNGLPYLFVSTGDNGISETNEPSCYTPQTNNPNNFAQDPLYKNGKVHRFHLNGSIPSDNPLPGNSFFTRGHRNPQGLMYNPNQDVIYEIEHGDRSDDEINVLKPGLNYGWKIVRGYHSDNNFPGEANYVATYTPYPGINGDALVEPLYAWCSTPQPTVSAFLDWCTVAPSDGLYYGSAGIPNWKNSLLVVTLKNGLSTDQEVYCFKLNADGISLKPSTTNEPNPSRFFASDQALNGRLRDIACSPDGKTLYLINNGGVAGETSNKIICYTYNELAATNGLPGAEFVAEIFPVPGRDEFFLRTSEAIDKIQMVDLLGVSQPIHWQNNSLKIEGLPAGTYLVHLSFVSGKRLTRKLILH